ncbi:hypothetical protein [Thioalkalivibrio sp. HK1]|uniref:hypothetical protein n=1 Tax=Thioalkalivibrio sp. HK1 TaxID=1469245 RepID=UPI0012DFB624|nr:hypothetical protein [Thioalkalivibrio sp. HK1]
MIDSAAASLAVSRTSIIPRVHSYRDAFEAIRTKAEELTYEDRAAAVELSKTWMLTIPHPHWPRRELAIATSANISGGLMLRLAESVQDESDFPAIWGQKSIVHVVGPIDAAKSTLTRFMLPKALHRFTLRNTKPKKDEVAMYRDETGVA